jgi:adenine-specific DNA-methyltransferase
LKNDWNGRLRTLLIPGEARAIYSDAKVQARAFRFGDLAKINIGYITGDNAFFHLSPSEAQRHQIPSEYLVPTVRRGKSLVGEVIDLAIVDQWVNSDEACFLLALPASLQAPRNVEAYLDSEAGLEARKTYKC